MTILVPVPQTIDVTATSLTPPRLGAGAPHGYHLFVAAPALSSAPDDLDDGALAILLLRAALRALAAGTSAPTLPWQATVREAPRGPLYRREDILALGWAEAALTPADRAVRAARVLLAPDDAGRLLLRDAPDTALWEIAEASPAIQQQIDQAAYPVAWRREWIIDEPVEPIP